ERDRRLGSGGGAPVRRGRRACEPTSRDRGLQLYGPQGWGFSRGASVEQSRPNDVNVAKRHEYDVVVIGAGGAGLRAAIEASAMGVRTALICKSLLGKAHTVMAEGGIAAALGNVWKEDNWKVHFRDTMRGGKLLNHWRMAQIHAQEAPDRVLELEEWG